VSHAWPATYTLNTKEIMVQMIGFDFLDFETLALADNRRVHVTGMHRNVNKYATFFLHQ